MLMSCNAAGAYVPHANGVAVVRLANTAFSPVVLTTSTLYDENDVYSPPARTDLKSYGTPVTIHTTKTPTTDYLRWDGNGQLLCSLKVTLILDSGYFDNHLFTFVDQYTYQQFPIDALLGPTTNGYIRYCTDEFNLRIKPGAQANTQYVAMSKNNTFTTTTDLSSAAKFVLLPPRDELTAETQSDILTCQSKCTSMQPDYVADDKDAVRTCKDGCALTLFSNVASNANNFSTKPCGSRVIRYQLSTGEQVRWWSMPSGYFYQPPSGDAATPNDYNTNVYGVGPFGPMTPLLLPSSSDSASTSDLLTKFTTPAGTTVGVFLTGGVYELTAKGKSVAPAQIVGSSPAFDYYVGPGEVRPGVPSFFFMYYRGKGLMPYFTAACNESKIDDLPFDATKPDATNPWSVVPPADAPNLQLQLTNMSAGSTVTVADGTDSSITWQVSAGGDPVYVRPKTNVITVAGASFFFTPTLYGLAPVQIMVSGRTVTVIDVDGYSCSKSTDTAASAVTFQEAFKRPLQSWVPFATALVCGAFLVLVICYVATR
jgi:hypothetical protein